MNNQPDPSHTANYISVTAAVIADIKLREAKGIAKYGTSLYTYNNRNALQDLYEELLDACQYLKQLLLEQEANDK